jgi:hypothetical protein
MVAPFPGVGEETLTIASEASRQERQFYDYGRLGEYVILGLELRRFVECCGVDAMGECGKVPLCAARLDTPWGTLQLYEAERVYSGQESVFANVSEVRERV